MTTIRITTRPSTEPPVALNIQLNTTLNITANEARRRVNRQLIPQLGTGLIASDPELSISGEQIEWRVPIILSLPGLGDLGEVGTVIVDAQTGDLAITLATQTKIVNHARWLYAGATLQAK
jgi:hypothetical protein